MLAVNQIQVETEAERVEQWRSDLLRQIGYRPTAAAELASRSDIDLHTAADLILDGCPEALALRILL